MDLARAPSLKRHRPLVLGGLGALLLVPATVGLSRLKRAAPTVDRSVVWLDTVRRGQMIRQVQGPGALVPEQIRWLSAQAAARVERIVVRSGATVTPETVLVELSNPELELAALEAERQIAAAEAERANLQATQASQRLAQESIVASLHSEHEEAQKRAIADDELARRGFLSALERGQSAGHAEELGGRLAFERRRLDALAQGSAAQGAAHQAQLARLRTIAAFRRREVEALELRAGVAGVVQELPLQVGQWVTPGTLLAKVAQPEHLKAELRIPETQAKDIQIGQPAAIDTHNGLIEGRVSRIDPAVQAGAVKVDVALGTDLPKGARPDLAVEGTIELERLEQALYVGRPAFGQPESTVGLFRLEADGTHASRVAIQLGRASVRTIEVRSGLAPGDQIILSDMSAFDGTDRVQLR